MKKSAAAVLLSFVALGATSSLPVAWARPSVDSIVSKLLEADPWGLAGATLSARATLTDKQGRASELSFSARSRRYSGTLSKAMVRFTAPPDISGAGFLQIQKQEADDDRFLFLPELKRSRRISGSLRGTSFMGTDFSFADLDRRDLRESTSILKEDENIGRYACHHLDSKPSRSDSPYSHVEIWLRTDNYLPLRMHMYDRANTLLKTFTALEVRRVKGQWYITKSRMVDHAQGHETKLEIASVEPTSAVADDEFTLRNLEKL